MPASKTPGVRSSSAKDDSHRKVTGPARKAAAVVAKNGKAQPPKAIHAAGRAASRPVSAPDAGRGSSLVKQAVDALRKRILAVAGGEVFLGSEEQLIEALGVSRPTFRQAARLLEHELLLKIKRGIHGGFFAQPPSASAVSRMAAIYLNAQGTTLQQISAATSPVVEEAAALLALGTAYAELEQVGEAERRLKAALALDPMMAEAHASLGAVYLMADRPIDARAAYERALAIDPEMIAAHQSLAGLASDAGEPDQARRHRDKAYGRQSLFVEAAADPVARVLILTTAEGGNVPFRFLLPKDRYTRLTWFIEYAAPSQAADLPAYDVVFNAIGDADLAGPTKANVEAFLAVNTRPVLNDPAHVERTARHLTPALLDGLTDVVTPPVARIVGRDLPSTKGLELPVLVRPIGSHGGKGLVRVETPEALAAVELKPDAEAYLTAYRDFASVDGLYRKYRMIFVDRRAYPYHLAISNDWLVHHGSAGMAGNAARIAEELAFLEDPTAAIGPRAMAAVRAIGRRLDLDYAGLDFAVLADGQVMVFEANATMLVHPEAPTSPFAHKNPYVEVILSAFQAMLARP